MPTGQTDGRIAPIPCRRRWRVLDEADVQRLDDGVVRTLGEVGVRLPLARALDVLERGGCRVDRTSQLTAVKINWPFTTADAPPKFKKL